MNEITIQRIYEDDADSKGKRILVDRLWPRGITKERARLDLWMKEIAPSTELRRTYHANTIDWEEFRRRYLRELEANQVPFNELLELARQGPITLLYGVKSETHNHALLLKQQLEAAMG